MYMILSSGFYIRVGKPPLPSQGWGYNYMYVQQYILHVITIKPKIIREKVSVIDVNFGQNWSRIQSERNFLGGGAYMLNWETVSKDQWTASKSVKRPVNNKQEIRSSNKRPVNSKSVQFKPGEIEASWLNLFLTLVWTLYSLTTHWSLS